MFGEVYDAISRVWSWRWPEVMGEVTAVDVEKINSIYGGTVRLRLAVAYKFSVNDDGPYAGEALWNPAFCPNRRVRAARHNIRVRHQVIVRYRPDDPSVNTLDHRIWQSL